MSEHQNRRMKRSFRRQGQMIKAHTQAMQRYAAGKGWQEPPYSWAQIKAEIRRYQFLQTAHWHRVKERNERLIMEHLF